MIVYAFVIKNFIPFSRKVQILHETLGKIMCIYPQGQQAEQLSVGSVMLCQVQRKGNIYTFDYLEIVYQINGMQLSDLEFIHHLLFICLHALPSNVALPDVIAVLQMSYHHLPKMAEYGRNIMIMRLLLLSELLPEDKDIYFLAMQDPLTLNLGQEQKIKFYIQQGFLQIKQQVLHR